MSNRLMPFPIARHVVARILRANRAHLSAPSGNLVLELLGLDQNHLIPPRGHLAVLLDSAQHAPRNANVKQISILAVEAIERVGPVREVRHSDILAGCPLQVNRKVGTFLGP